MSRPRILLILDLNGTILESTFKPQSRELRPDGQARKKTVYFRPYMHEFIAFALEHFEVAVWTSNIRPNANALVSLAFAEKADQLRFVFARDECLIGQNYSSTKPLQRVWAKFKEYNNTNTFIIDDSHDKVLPQQRSNHIFIHNFTASCDTLATDTYLQRLEEYLRMQFLQGDSATAE